MPVGVLSPPLPPPTPPAAVGVPGRLLSPLGAEIAGFSSAPPPPPSVFVGEYKPDLYLSFIFLITETVADSRLPPAPAPPAPPPPPFSAPSSGLRAPHVLYPSAQLSIQPSRESFPGVASAMISPSLSRHSLLMVPAFSRRLMRNGTTTLVWKEAERIRETFRVSVQRVPREWGSRRKLGESNDLQAERERERKRERVETKRTKERTR